MDRPTNPTTPDYDPAGNPISRRATLWEDGDPDTADATVDVPQVDDLTDDPPANAPLV